MTENEEKISTIIRMQLDAGMHVHSTYLGMQSLGLLRPGPFPYFRHEASTERSILCPPHYRQLANVKLFCILYFVLERNIPQSARNNASNGASEIDTKKSSECHSVKLRQSQMSIVMKRCLILETALRT